MLHARRPVVRATECRGAAIALPLPEALDFLTP
jgi:hypothetical protein